MDTVADEQLEQLRIIWFKQHVRQLPFRGSSPQAKSCVSVISRMNYKNIHPPIKNQDDLFFLQSIDMAWFCLHAMMTLPCLGLMFEENKNTPSGGSRSTVKRSLSALSDDCNDTAKDLIRWKKFYTMLACRRSPI